MVELSRQRAMDPDRYQMRAMKRQIIQLEKAMVRAEVRIRGLQAFVGELVASGSLAPEEINSTEDE